MFAASSLNQYTIAVRSTLNASAACTSHAVGVHHGIAASRALAHTSR